MASPFSDYPAVVRHLETRLLVADLKDILKDLNLSSSGNKKPLIERVKNHLSLLKAANDVSRYNTVKTKITRYGSSPAFAAPHPRTSLPVSQLNPLVHASPVRMPYAQYMNSPRSFDSANHAPHQLVLNFKASPFYDVVERLSNPAILPYSGRNTVSMSFVCSAMSLDLLNRQPTKYKVGLMCADSTYSYDSSRRLLMEFPNPSEILVNARKVHVNLRGMKNKPGTVPPADITSYVDQTPRIANRLDIVYSSGTDVHKKYGAQVALLRTHSVEALVQKIKDGNRFTKESVLEKLRKPNDDDIEMASFDLTLKDPLSYMRITVPCRSLFCKHNQCWDAMAFLSINEQTPQWTCPICHIAINGLDAIGVDRYFQDILEKVDSEVDTILVDPQGNWKVPDVDKTRPQPRTNAKNTPESPREVLDLGDTEDEEESKASLTVSRHIREPSSTASIPSSTIQSVKRKALPVCIDLTEDSDDEPEPPKRVKHSDSIDTRQTLLAHKSRPDDSQVRIPQSETPPTSLAKQSNLQHPSASASTRPESDKTLAGDHIQQPSRAGQSLPALPPIAKQSNGHVTPDLVRSRSHPESRASLGHPSRPLSRAPITRSLGDQIGFRSQSVPLSGARSVTSSLNHVHQCPEDIFDDIPSPREPLTLGGISLVPNSTVSTNQDGLENPSLRSLALPVTTAKPPEDVLLPTLTTESRDLDPTGRHTSPYEDESYHAYSDDFSDGQDY